MGRHFENHPRRIQLANELHARPFEPVPAPGRLVHLAFKKPVGAAERNPDIDRRHLTDLLDRHGAQYPAPNSDHFIHDLGRFRLSWERHTEFVSYTLYQHGEGEEAFDSSLADVLPQDWLDNAPGQVIAATQIELLRAESREAALKLTRGPLARQFHGGSLAMADVLDGCGLALGDFRVHEGDFVRFAVIVHGECGDRRVGRLVRRLTEIETYRTVAMLAFPIARQTAARLNEIEREMTRLIQLVASPANNVLESEILTELTELAAELEALSAATAFRFGAGRAYEALVNQRIASLRESRVEGRQLFSEFMARRFEPAMRTCNAAEQRLQDLSLRAGRIGGLLSTRVNVAVEAQNQRLLSSMDRRAALQVRLQETVEGVSVVAISYYAVSLVGYLLYPLGNHFGMSKEMVTGSISVPIILIVFGFIRRLKRKVHIDG